MTPPHSFYFVNLIAVCYVCISQFCLCSYFTCSLSTLSPFDSHLIVVLGCFCHIKIDSEFRKMYYQRCPLAIAQVRPMRSTLSLVMLCQSQAPPHKHTQMTPVTLLTTLWVPEDVALPTAFFRETNLTVLILLPHLLKLCNQFMVQDLSHQMVCVAPQLQLLGRDQSLSTLMLSSTEIGRAHV